MVYRMDPNNSVIKRLWYNFLMSTYYGPMKPSLLVAFIRQPFHDYDTQKCLPMLCCAASITFPKKRGANICEPLATNRQSEAMIIIGAS